MKFENKGKWVKEAEDKLAAYDTQEHPDYLDGDNKVCTFEDDEIANFEEDDLDIVEEDDTLDSPEDEEMDLAMEAAMPPIGQRKRIEFEDDIVRVYDGNKEIYAGAEDYEPMQDEDWKWDNANKYYKFDKYIKVCCESAQKNEDNPIKGLVKGRTYTLKDDLYVGDTDSVYAEDYEIYNKLNFIDKDSDITIPKGTKLTYKQSGSNYLGQPNRHYEVFLLNGKPVHIQMNDMLYRVSDIFESVQKNEGSNWEYSVSVLDNYGDIQYSTDCKSQSDIDNAIKKYKARSVELRNADNCTTIEVTKDLVDDDGNILKSQSIKKISL